MFIENEPVSNPFHDCPESVSLFISPFQHVRALDVHAEFLCFRQNPASQFRLVFIRSEVKTGFGIPDMFGIRHRECAFAGDSECRIGKFAASFGSQPVGTGVRGRDEVSFSCFLIFCLAFERSISVKKAFAIHQSLNLKRRNCLLFLLYPTIARTQALQQPLQQDVLKTTFFLILLYQLTEEKLPVSIFTGAPTSPLYLIN